MQRYASYIYTEGDLLLSCFFSLLGAELNAPNLTKIVQFPGLGSAKGLEV